MGRLTLIIAPFIAGAAACSSWFMGGNPDKPWGSPEPYHVSARTTDLAVGTFVLATQPVGSMWANGPAGPVAPSKYGALTFMPAKSNPSKDVPEKYPWPMAGLNTAGLSCDAHRLANTTYPPKLNRSSDVKANDLCSWTLANFATVAEVKAAAVNVSFWGDSVSGGPAGIHFAVRDATGVGLSFEWLSSEACPEGCTAMTEDRNDDGKTGYGVMTNNPPFSTMIQMMRYIKGYQVELTSPSFAMPGGWTTHDRFVRIAMIKATMTPPRSRQEAIVQTAHVLNSITVPGLTEGLHGTDTGGPWDWGQTGVFTHTLHGAIYDHDERTVYFRTINNMNLQRLKLADLSLEKGAPQKILPVENNSLPWFNDAAHALL